MQRRPSRRPRALVGSLVTAVSLLAVTGCGVDVAVVAQESEPIPERTASDPPVEPTEPIPSTEPPATDPPSSTAPPTTTPDTASPDSTLPPVAELPARPVIDLGDTTLADVAVLDDGRTPRPYDDLVAAALVDLEAWMTEVHLVTHGQPWLPLQGGVWPAHAGRTDVPGCGEPETTYPQIQEFAAFFCAEGDFLVYDDGPESLLGSLAAEFGDAVLGVVLAHEYGHVLQSRTGDLDRGLATVVTEQQADCIAGAWVARVAGGQSSVLQLTDDDVRGGLITMVAVRDPVGADQFEMGGHGTAFDRVGAFQDGFIGGAARCATMIDDPLPLMPNRFQTITDARNDGDLPFGYEPGQIMPLVVDTLNSYWQFQLRELDPSASPFPTVALVPVPASEDVDCASGLQTVAPGVGRCDSDGQVYLDDAIARAMYDDPIVGSADFAVGYLVALAWSDLVQTALGSPLTGVARALANDCLAGAYTRDLDPLRPDRPGEGERAGTISPGDLDEAVVAAIELGDDRATDQALGTAFQKVDAFRGGVLGGIDACLERIGS